MNKKLVVYFAKDGGQDVEHPYENIRENVEDKQEVLLDVFPSNIEIYIARGENSHIFDNTFQPQFVRSNKTWSKYNGIPVNADLVIGFNIPKAVSNVFNTIREITHDKTILENLFPKYVIQSIICNNYEDIKQNFGSISTDLKVLKPIKGTRSKGIFIQDNLPGEDEISSEFYPYLLQEFLDTSRGFYQYPGIHDFRVILLGGKIIGKFLRQPEVGKYTANSFRRGGLIDLIDWKIPEEIKKIINEVEYYCASRYKHRYYSVDFGIGNNGEIKIFEMNSAPGLTNDIIARKLGEYMYENFLKVT